MKSKQLIASFLVLSLAAGLCACAKDAETNTATDSSSRPPVADAEEKAYIEETLNLSNNTELSWTYSADADAWVMSIVSAVAYPELPDQQGVSVCVPGAYVTGIDTDGDGEITDNDVAGWISVLFSGDTLSTYLDIDGDGVYTLNDFVLLLRRRNGGEN